MITKTMADPVNICQTCLSSDRQLKSTSEIHSVLQEIRLEELENKNICWECLHVIMRFFKFRKQVESADTALSKTFQELKTFSKLLNSTKIQYDYEFSYNSDPLNTPVSDDKSELIPIKPNNLNNDSQELSCQDYNSDIDDKELKVFVDIFNNKNQKIKPKKEILVKRNKKKIKDISVADFKDKFKTVLITEDEMLRSKEEKKNQPNYKKIPFKCDMCVLGFTTKENFELHFEKKHNKNIGAHKCNVCSTRFASIPMLHRHQSKHYKHYACTLCDYKTSAMKAAINHCRNKHKMDGRDRIHCKQCTAVFRTPKELAAHTKKDHVLYCNECGEKFKGKHTLRTHQVRIHLVKREFSCDTCGRSFLTRSRLESHAIKHSQAAAKRLAYCSQCRIQYKDIHVYRNHVRNSVAHAHTRYQCPECNKKFASKVYWNKHYNFYHLKKSQYKCDTCNKLFISEWRLKNHRQKHHGLTRTRNHECKVCGKKFYTLSTLRGHQLTHSDKREYMCEDCGDTFKQRPALYTHARLVHKGRKLGRKCLS